MKNRVYTDANQAKLASGFAYMDLAAAIHKEGRHPEIKGVSKGGLNLRTNDSEVFFLGCFNAKQEVARACHIPYKLGLVRLDRNGVLAGRLSHRELRVKKVIMR